MKRAMGCRYLKLINTHDNQYIITFDNFLSSKRIFHTLKRYNNDLRNARKKIIENMHRMTRQIDLLI